MRPARKTTPPQAPPALSSRKPSTAILDRKKHCPAFQTLPDNAFGISGMTPASLRRVRLLGLLQRRRLRGIQHGVDIVAPRVVRLDRIGVEIVDRDNSSH